MGPEDDDDHDDDDYEEEEEDFRHIFGANNGIIEVYHDRNVKFEGRTCPIDGVMHVPDAAATRPRQRAPCSVVLVSIMGDCMGVNVSDTVFY